MDLHYIPFSCRGSYMAVSMDNRDALVLRTVSSRAPKQNVLRIVPVCQGTPLPFHAENAGALLRILTEQGTIALSFLDSNTLHFQGIGSKLGLILDEISQTDSCNYIHTLIPRNENLVCVNCYKNLTRHVLRRESGTLCYGQKWDREESHDCTVRAEAENGSFSFSLKDVSDNFDCSFPEVKPQDAQTHSLDEILSFIPAQCRDSTPAFNAAYLLWSSAVAPAGPLKREGILMSKNWMTSVWSWDHCFNALGLCQAQPKLAWDQFMIPFDHQAPDGSIPDFVNDTLCFHNCVKPPVHGWALRKMMEHMSLSSDQIREAYTCLSRWTDWWLLCRDLDRDGLCEYWHGNDSGWDNSTVFLSTPHVISPELSAFLVVQMDVLGDLADLLNDPESAAYRRAQAGELAKRMYRILFRNDLPISIEADTGHPIRSQSLLPYLSLLAGEHLPASCREKMAEVLLGTEYLTSQGFLTEARSSPEFLEDGYWRGAVWPPVMALLTDALLSCGKRDSAALVAQVFCRMAEAHGFSENYSGITGRCQRDPAYTWAAGVYFFLKSQFESF